MYFRLMAVMFDLLVTRMSESIHVSPTVLLDPENVGVAVKNPLPATIQDLYNPSHKCFRYHIRHFDFRLNTVGFKHSVAFSAATVTSAFSKISEAKLH